MLKVHCNLIPDLFVAAADLGAIWLSLPAPVLIKVCEKKTNPFILPLNNPFPHFLLMLPFLPSLGYLQV